MIKRRRYSPTLQDIVASVILAFLLCGFSSTYAQTEPVVDGQKYVLAV